jgi:peptide-methionine (R)-S-oxide reductase
MILNQNPKGIFSVKMLIFFITVAALLLLFAGLIFLPAAAGTRQQKNSADQAAYCGNQPEETNTMKGNIDKTNKEWKAELTDEQYRILRQKGTERPFTGKYNDFKGKGIFLCAACGNELFSSDTKYNSGSGWPSFYAPVGKDNITLEEDNSLFMKRTEVLCSRCGGHLGHVFDDGPAPTHLRYCINSGALQFEDQKKTEKDSTK